MAIKKRVLVPLAEGFEEIEAVAIIDVLRRGGIEVVVAGLDEGQVMGSHGIVIEANALFDRVDIKSFDMIVLPGGPAHRTLAKDARVLQAVKDLHRLGRLTAAVCAAPVVLARAGVIKGVPVTSHPSVRDQLGDADVRSSPRVLRSGKVITSQGPGTSIEFALELVAELSGRATADEIAAAMVVYTGA